MVMLTMLGEEGGGKRRLMRDTRGSGKCPVLDGWYGQEAGNGALMTVGRSPGESAFICRRSQIRPAKKERALGRTNAKLGLAPPTRVYFWSMLLQFWARVSGNVRPTNRPAPSSACPTNQKSSVKWRYTTCFIRSRPAPGYKLCATAGEVRQLPPRLVVYIVRISSCNAHATSHATPSPHFPALSRSLLTSMVSAR